MSKTIPNELWMEVFSNLSPVDLCFIISPVCKLFYELSSDNALWRKFKADNWTLESLKTTPIKRKSFLKKEFTEQEGIFKKIYFQWLQEQVTIIRNNLTCYIRVQKGTKGGVPVRTSTPRIHNGRRHFNFAIASRINLENFQLVIKNQNVENTNIDKDSLYDLSKLFNPEKMDITLQTHVLKNSRWGEIRAIQNMMAYFDGILFFATEGKDEKNYISIAKKLLHKNSHLIIIDATPLTKSAPLPPDFEIWAKSLNIEFMQFNALDNALNRMVDVINSRLECDYPKYLPTTQEFNKYAFNGQLPAALNGPIYSYWY